MDIPRPVLVLALWLAGCPSTPPAPLEKQRVILLGVDGASWNVIGRMIAAGELPAFARLVEQGAHMPRFETMDTTDSPLVWTSVATGQPPAVHGITDYTEELPGGGKVPITSNGRRVPAIWNIASDHGLSVGVVGWWASWPAEKVDGYVVSDHANPVQAGWMSADSKYWTADEEALRSLHEDTWPPELSQELARYWIDPEAFPADEFQRRSGLTDEQVRLAARAPWNRRGTYSWLKTFYALDQPLFAAAHDLGRARAPDLQYVYLRGPDPLQHYAWDLVEPERFARKPANLERDRGIVEGTYRYVDGFIGELLADLPADTTLIVASDHGAEPAADARRKKRKSRPGRHSTAAKGVLFIYGPHAKAGRVIDDADPLDLMPTVAWLLGLPLAADLPGEPIEEAFTRDFRKRRGKTTVPTYGQRETAPPLPSTNDATMLEQLRGLGYIEEGGD